MPRTISKYPLTLDSAKDGHALYHVELPVGATIIHVGRDGHSQSCLWAEVDPAVEMVEHVEMAIVPTGGTVPEPGGGDRYYHLRTFTDEYKAMTYVWHVYQKMEVF